MANRAKAITISWLAQNLFAKLPVSVIADYPPLQATLDSLRKLEDTANSLPIRSVQYDDVLEMFSLTENRGEIWTLQQHDLYNPSDTMTAILGEIQFIVKKSPQNEAYARCILNNILVCCVAEEKRFARSTAQIDSSIVAVTDHTQRPTTLTAEPAELSLRFKTSLKYQVTYKRESRILSGLADYTLWYDNTELMGTNLVVVEAKRYEALGEATAQIVAYMAIVHATRREEGKQNSDVYGICSDGIGFRFFRIDNEGVLTRSELLEWNFESNQPRIVSFIRYIVRAAIASSPTTIPVKIQQNREVTLRFFSSPEKKEEFDYGIGCLGLEEGYEMELVDLPDNM